MNRILKIVNFTYIFLTVLLLYDSCDNAKQNQTESPVKTFNKRIRIVERDAEKKVDIFIDDRLFTSYIYPFSIKKPVLYPVNTASGITVTRGYPLAPHPGDRIDHPHQVGIWLNHGDVNDLDFWNNSDSIPSGQSMHYGTIYHQSVKKVHDDDKVGYLEVSCNWKRPDGRIILEENTHFNFSGDSISRIIDRITRLSANEIGVIFKDSKEGLNAIRVCRELEQPADEPFEALNDELTPVMIDPSQDSVSAGLYISSEGLTGDDVWGSRARWVKLKSTDPNKVFGIIMMDHPDNPDHPVHWMARGYGLFAANPFGLKIYSNGANSLNYFIPEGESVTLKYRFYIYNDIEPDDDAIEAIYQQFVDAYQEKS